MSKYFLLICEGRHLWDIHSSYLFFCSVKAFFLLHYLNIMAYRVVQIHFISVTELFMFQLQPYSVQHPSYHWCPQLPSYLSSACLCDRHSLPSFYFLLDFVVCNIVTEGKGAFLFQVVFCNKYFYCNKYF